MARQARRPHVRPRPSGPWKYGPIPVIGIVGGIGSGKSAVAALLADLGAFRIDADGVGHTLLNQRPVRDLVIERFGPRILEPTAGDGTFPDVDRKALGAIVFADKKALTDLESILHPRMKATFAKAITRTVRRDSSKAVVLDAAILFEAGWADLCDKVVFVDAPREVRLARVKEHRGWDEAKLDAREATQMALSEKIERSDAVVLNSQDLDALKLSVGRVWDSILGSPPPRRKPAPLRHGPGTPPRPSAGRPQGRNTGR